MTLLETYAMECGVQPPEMAHEFPTNFHPLPAKYITLASKSNQSAKDYSYFDLVVAMLAPHLQKTGIQVIQLGLPGEPPIPGAIKANLTLRQTAGAIKNSLLHVGIDSMTSHLAGHFGTPLIELFGSTAAASTGPHYKGKHLFIEGYKGLPSRQAEEHPKAIDSIMPETVANAALRMLGITDSVNIVTKYIGVRYNRPSCDLIPNFRPDYANLPNCPLTVRMDQCHNEAVLLEMVRILANPFVVCLNKSLPANFPKHKFSSIVYFFSDLAGVDRSLFKSEVPTTFIYIGPRENIHQIRLELESPFNAPFINLLAIPEKVEDLSSTFLNTQRAFMSGGQFYASLFHAKRGIPGLAGIPVGKGAEDDDFLQILDNCHIYVKR